MFFSNFKDEKKINMQNHDLLEQLKFCVSEFLIRSSSHCYDILFLQER